MEPESYKQYQLTNNFFSDEAYAVIFEAGVFDALYKHDVKLMQKKMEDL